MPLERVKGSECFNSLAFKIKPLYMLIKNETNCTAPQHLHYFQTTDTCINLTHPSGSNQDYLLFILKQFYTVLYSWDNSKLNFKQH